MQPLSALNKEVLKDIKVVSFDVDGVLIQKGTDIEEVDNSFSTFLKVRTKKITPELIDKIIRLKKYLHINVSSGRNLLYLIETFDPILWDRASLQGENGLFTLIGGKVIQHGSLSFEELEFLRTIKNQIHNQMKTNKNIRGFEPKQFLISVHCFKEEPAIEEMVRALDIKGEFGVKWSSEAYNIFPKRISKGTGLMELSKILKVNLSQILVVGNDPNDKEAAEGPGVSVTTSPDTLTADYFTESALELGGESLVNQLLKIYESK